MPRVAVTNKLRAVDQEPSEVASPESLGLEWLVRTRWWAVVGQVAIWLMSRDWLGLDVQTGPALGVAGVMLLSNAALALLDERKKQARWIASVLFLDVVLLTALLFFTGREASPFSAFYIVNVAIAARVASPRVTALVWLLSTMAFGSLFVGAGHQGAHATHYRGMWVAYALAAALTGYFVARVSAALLDRDQRLQRLRRASQAAQRLAATSTLAASAAHELGTPQNTIAVLAEAIAGSAQVPERYRVDAKLILSQIDRCRDIVHDLDGQTAANGADELAKVSVRDVLTDAISALNTDKHIVLNASADLQAVLPGRAFSRVASSLLKNALDAGATAIVVEARESKDKGLLLSVRDDGAGIAGEVLERLGEPYLTTKPIGSGSGLGLYLCSVFAESLGGAMHVDSEPGRGTTVELRIPAHG